MLGIKAREHDTDVTYINVMRTRDNMRDFESTKVTSNNWETGYEATRVTSACTFLVG